MTPTDHQPKIPQKCHFIGIGGIGMSGLARLLLHFQSEVSGSDIQTNYVTEALLNQGAKIHFGHSAAHISPDMTVIYSSDIKKENSEYQAAAQYQCPILHRSDLLHQLMLKHKSLAVTGTHGKTTTTSLLASVLLEAKLNPSYIVGGMLIDQHSNAAYGGGEYFVAEADESDGTFLKYSPFGSIVTNIDHDHMNFFQSEENLISSFKQYMSQVTSPLHLFWCGDDPLLRRISSPGISYGFSTGCMLKGSNFRQKGWKIIFDVSFQGKDYHDLEVALTGRHNALNALAVFGLALRIGIAENTIRNALKQFCGVMRRCEKKWEQRGMLFLDDYGHHPTEIDATLRAVRLAVHERRLRAVFQPHRYSRMQHCLGHFGRVFESADEVIVTDIFTSGEEPIAGVTSEVILKELQKCHPNCYYVAREKLASVLAATLVPHDVVVSLGAGDITKLGMETLKVIEASAPSKLTVGVICGGCSGEHEISLRSVQHILSSLNRDYYNVVPFGITKEGAWICSQNVIEDLKELPVNAKRLPSDVLEKLLSCDILFPMLHGPNGEDGTVQGFFEVLGKPYAGPDFRSAAVAMDKALTKKLMVAAGIATSPFVDFSRHRWRTRKEEVLRQIEEKLNYPVYVKPVHLGSTIGVSKAIDEVQLCQSIENALSVDVDILVENEIVGRELEFAIFGSDVLRVFPPGEIFSSGNIYDYEAKYGVAAMKFTTPIANLSENLKKEGMIFAEKAYLAAGCQGMARVDCFLDGNGNYFLNEINPIPGFTPTSLFPQMCEKNGIKGSDLVDWLVIIALSHHREKRLDDT